MIKLFIKQFVTLTFLLSVVLYFYNYQFPVTAFDPLISFLFLFVATALLVYGFFKLNEIFPTYTAFGFLAVIMIKLLAISIYLLPHIKGEEIYPKSDLFFFSIPYFSYLIFEALIVIKLLNKK
mgnify:CR=1 FL=1